MDGLIWALLALAVAALVVVALTVRGGQRAGRHRGAAGIGRGPAASAGATARTEGDQEDGGAEGTEHAGRRAAVAGDTVGGNLVERSTAEGRGAAHPGSLVAESSAAPSYDERHSAHWQDGRPPIAADFPGDERAAGMKERVEGHREPPDREHA